MSAPLRYARILNGFSFLISSRSAISRRMRAIPALSNLQPLGVDVKLEDTGAARGERLLDGGSLVRRAVAEEASAAAGAADLGCGRSGSRRAGDEVVDGGGRDARCKTLAVVPLDRNEVPDLDPVGSFER